MNAPAKERRVAIELASRPQGASSRELHEATGMSFHATKQLMTRMVQAGLLFVRPGMKKSDRRFATAELAAAYVPPPKPPRVRIKKPKPATAGLAEGILKALNETPAGLFSSELATMFKRKPKSIAAKMQKLRQQGKVEGNVESDGQSTRQKRWFAIAHYEPAAPKIVTFRIAPAKPRQIDTTQRFKDAPAVIPPGLKPTICPPTRCEERWAVTLPPGGGVITRDWRERRLSEMA